MGCPVSFTISAVWKDLGTVQPMPNIARRMRTGRVLSSRSAMASSVRICGLGSLEAGGRSTGGEATNVVQGLFDRGDHDTRHASGFVELGEEEQVFVVVGFGQAAAGAGAQGAVGEGVGFHVVCD